MLSVNNFSTNAIISTKIVVQDTFNIGLVKVTLTVLARKQRQPRANNCDLCTQVSAADDRDEWNLAELQVQLNDEPAISLYVSNPASVPYSKADEGTVTAVYYAPYTTFMPGTRAYVRDSLVYWMVLIDF